MFYDGLAATRYAKSLAIAGGDPLAALGFAEQQSAWGEDRASIVQRIKAGVGGIEAGTVAAGHGLEADLLGAVKERSIVGRLALQRVSPLVPLLTSAARTRAYFVRAGGALRLVAGTYSRSQGLRLGKVGALLVATLESLRDPAFERSLQQDLIAACADALDLAFFDPDNDGSGASSAAVTNGAVPIDYLGGGVLGLDDALRAAMQMLSESADLARAVWAMPASLAGSLALARGADGALAYPGLGVAGGMLCGLPVLTSGAIGDTPSSDGELISLVDPSAIAFADELPSIGTATDAMVEMDSDPAGDATAPTAATANLVSMFQTESACLRVTLPCAWQLRRPGAVQVIVNVPSELASS
jgi:hypothetical protein